VLPPYPEDLSRKAEASLIRVGVRPCTGVHVVGIDESGVNVEHGDGRTEHLAARTVIWAAGVRASAFGEILARRAGAVLEKGGRVVVGPDLSLPGCPEIFVIGDLAHTTDRHGRPLSGIAQVAMQQGSYVAGLIGRRTGRRRTGGGGAPHKPFRYRDRGDLAVIGRAAAVARIGGLHLSGFVAWLIWLFVHLMYLVEFSNRLLVFIHWGFLYLTFNRGARLITGAEGPEEL
jgi:NADH dehydrogenase